MESFQAIQPSVLLTPYVKQYWFMSADNEKQRSQRAIPSGSMGLVFNRGGKIYASPTQEALPQSYLFGQSTAYTNLHFEQLDLIVIVFQPIGAKAFFRMPMDEFRQESISLDNLYTPSVIELEDRLMNTSNNQTCVYWIEQFLLKQIYEFDTHKYRRLVASIQLMHEGEYQISKLAQESCLSYKQFKRIFAEYVGLNPKDYRQIIRLSKVLHLLQTKPASSLNELAYESDYYDKSHLIREIKSFLGYTPKEFLSKCDPYSDYKSLFQSFFVDTD